MRRPPEEGTFWAEDGCVKELLLAAGIRERTEELVRSMGGGQKFAHAGPPSLFVRWGCCALRRQ